MKQAAFAGDVIDRRYAILRLIGRGMMADVFEAEDRGAGRTVAVKIMRESMARDVEARRRFVLEARVQELVKHPNVAVLFDVGVHGNKPYLVVELLRGRSLAHVLKSDGRVEPWRAAHFAWQALQGLAATHAQGVLHRDLKPANLMLEAPAAPEQPGAVERVVLIDFGFASLEGMAGITQQGHVVGSLAYLAPERLRGEPADERADLYGVGVILYEMLTGRRPFMAVNDNALMAQHLTDEPPPPRQVAPEAAIPPALEAVVLRSLAKWPVQRAPTATAMADEISVALRAP